MVDISRALKIEGFMDEPDLIWLAEQAQTHSCIVEVGSYLGRSTRALADNTNGIVYAIDDWWGPRDIFLEKDERKVIFQTFQSNLQDLIILGKVKILKIDHNYFPKGLKPDMVFIDGDHAYPNVVRDTKFWKNELVENGLLCGHDARDIQVSMAIKHTIGTLKLAMNAEDIWLDD